MVQYILYPFLLIKSNLNLVRLIFKKSNICGLMIFEICQFDFNRREFLLTHYAFVGISGLFTIPLEVAVEQNTL